MGAILRLVPALQAIGITHASVWNMGVRRMSQLAAFTAEQAQMLCVACLKSWLWWAVQVYSPSHTQTHSAWVLLADLFCIVHCWLLHLMHRGCTSWCAFRLGSLAHCVGIAVHMPLFRTVTVFAGPTYACPLYR